MIAQLLVGFLMTFLQTIQFFAFFLFIANPMTWSSILITGLVLLLFGVLGLLFGMTISIIVDSNLAAFILSQSAAYPITLISGESSSR
jgi:hypothetical protein